MASKRSERIARLEGVIRRIASGRLDDPHDVDDVVQETLTRLLEAEERLELRTLAAYAVVTTRNVVTSLQRRGATADKHAPQLVDPSSPLDPQDVALQSEEHEALVVALAGLEAEERKALVDHEVLEVPTAAIAKEQGRTPGATATRLARVRARTRVDFLLAYRRLPPVSERCRPVLYAVAAGEKRRQQELNAAEHIEACPVCSQLVEPLTRKSRRLAAFGPLAAAGEAARRAGRGVRSHPAASVAAGATAVAVVAVLVWPSPPRTQPEPRPLTIGGVGALPLPDDFRWDRHEGATAVATGAPVESVPHDEGFWVGIGGSQRVWVELEVAGAESGPRIRPGGRVWFKGRLVRHSGDWVRSLGLSRGDGVRLLRSQGFHIVVREQHLTKVASS